ncbi:hypothetical protein ABQ352_23250 [Enterobacter hormaechei]
MKTSIINGSEVSRLSVAIQFDLFNKAKQKPLEHLKNTIIH